jgi:hypothetical protein
VSFDDVNSAADELGGNWFKFERVGDVFDVRLVGMRVREQRDFETGAVKLTRKTGEPRKEWIVTGMDDSGDLVKTAFSEGAQTAASAARKVSGASSFQPGGRLVLKYTGDRTPPGAKFAYKDFAARYSPPAAQSFEAGAEPGPELSKAVPVTGGGLGSIL